MAKKADAQARNDDITTRMRGLFNLAEQKRYNEVADLKSDVELLFATTEWGFREIILLVVLVKLRDSTYDAETDLYACHPRSIYEKAIRPELNARKIPTRQSGPLNIAKRTEGLNDAWVGRKTKPAMHAVVRLVRRINGFNSDDLTNFAAWVHSKFLEVATSTAALTVVVPPNSDPVVLSQVCRSLIENAPDAGNTPQRIVGYLLETYHEEAETGVVVKGHLDRASTTSTTSKKPGDVSEYSQSNTLLAVYEVTVKGFTQQRVQEAYEALAAVSPVSSLLIPTITVLCRPSDKHPEANSEVDSTVFLGEYEHNSLRFFFIDLYEWITIQLLRLPVSGRARFYQKLDNYITDHNTAIKVKEHWRDLHTETALPDANDE
jgi:hypothetical protein